MDWTRAERMQDNQWKVIDCRQCESQELNHAFRIPLMVCSHPEVRRATTDKPACEVARAPYGACGQAGKHWKARAKS